MPQELPNKLIEEIAAEIPEPQVSLPDEKVLEKKVLETTEKHAARLLAIASNSVYELEAHHPEIVHISHQIANRARAWSRAAQRLQKEIDAMVKESERMEKLADDLAEVADRLSGLKRG